MYGSIFYNCWTALLAFTIYFFVALSQSQLPSKILIGSFVIAILSFFVMFAVRYFLAYVLYTPTQQLFEDFTYENEIDSDQPNHKQQINTDLQLTSDFSTVEYHDESPQEIANVVRTMMEQDDTVIN